jgi:flagellar basal-body rod protein FlgB
MLSPLVDRMERYMSLLSARQQLVATNVANADTPGYKTVDVDFKAELQNQMTGKVSPTPTRVDGLDTKNDGNNVNLDREAQLLAENALRFQVATQIVRSQIRSIKTAIKEGRTG